MTDHTISRPASFRTLGGVSMSSASVRTNGKGFGIALTAASDGVGKMRTWCVLATYFDGQAITAKRQLEGQPGETRESVAMRTLRELEPQLRALAGAKALQEFARFERMGERLTAELESER